MESPPIQVFTKKMLSERVFSCVVCENLLTVPVMIVENVGNVCHLCFENGNTKNNWKGIPNEKLNLILKALQFPCLYEEKGCNVVVSYDNLKEHENQCIFRVVECLLPKEEYDWNGRLVDLFKHFKAEHPKHVLNNPCEEFSFNMSISKPVNVIKLFNNKSKVYVFRIKEYGKEKDLFHYMQDLKPASEDIEMSVKYLGKNGQHKIQLRRLSFSSTCDESNGKKIKLTTIQEITNSGDDVGIVIKPKNCELKNINSEVLKYLECPVCKELMRPPIHQCSVGHSFCNNCRQKLPECPTCRQVWGNPAIRNFALEGLTPSVQYPCVYSQFGCIATFSGSEIKNHEGRCEYKMYSCPATGCHFSGNYPSTKNHFKLNHTNDLVEGTVLEANFAPLANRATATEQTKYMFEHGNIYKLTFKRLSDSCNWSAQILNDYDDSIKYFHTVSITHSRIKQRKIAKSNLCLRKDEKVTNEAIVSFSYDNLALYKNTNNSDQINYYWEIYNHIIES